MQHFSKGPKVEPWRRFDTSSSKRFGCFLTICGDTYTESNSCQLCCSNTQGQVLHQVLGHAGLMEDVKDVEKQLDRRQRCWYQTCCCLWLCWGLNIQQWLRRTEHQRRGRPASASAISRCERWGPPSPSSPSLPVSFPSLPAYRQAPSLGPPQAKATARLVYVCYNKIWAWFRISPPVMRNGSRNLSWCL